MPAFLLDSDAAGSGGVAVSSWNGPSVDAPDDGVFVIGLIATNPQRTLVPPAGWTSRLSEDAVNTHRYTVLDRYAASADGPYSDSFSVTGGTTLWSMAQLIVKAKAGETVPRAKGQVVGPEYSDSAVVEDHAVTVSLDEAPEPGNVLVLVSHVQTYAGVGGGTGFHLPAGWHHLVQVDSGDDLIVGADVWWKVATGDEEAIDFTANMAHNHQIALQVVEYPIDTLSEAVGWDVFAANDLNGNPLVTLENARERMIRFEEDGAGVGGFRINRHSPEATAAILAKGNCVKVRFPEISDGYIGGFFIERGDFELLSSDEQGAEVLNFGGAGLFSYLHRARMDAVAYSTGIDTVDTWEKVWATSAIPNPVGAAVVNDDPTFLYVISATKRKVYKIRQADKKVVRTSPALWSGDTNYAGGLSADPADATILWALEAPWSRGGGGNTKIRKVRISDWAILDTFNLGSAVKLTEVKASSTHLWASRYETNNPIQKRSKTDGSVVTNYDPTFNGNDLELATGVSYNHTEDLLAYWFAGKQRAYIADPSAPVTIIDRISTKGISAFGGDWTTEGIDQFFYPVSYTADKVWKYKVVDGTPHDPVDGDWRLDEGTPGAILWRTIVEAQHPDRPQKPIPDVTYEFDDSVDTGGNAWDSHPGTEEFTASVGDYLDETDARLIPFGLTMQMQPDFELRAWNADDYGVDRTSGAFAASKVRVEGGENAAERLAAQMDDREVDSHMLVVGQAGAFARSVLDDLGYVREGFLATDLTSTAAMEGTGDAELARQRRDADAQAVVIPWADGLLDHDELHGFYLPGPAGTNGHYWVGDTIRLHSGDGEFDLVEQDRDVKAITIEELENGAWAAVADVSAIFVPIFDSIDSGRRASRYKVGGDIGGTDGAGTQTIVKPQVVVKDSLNGESYAAGTIESDDWGVSQPGAGRVEVSIRRQKLGELRDVDVPEVTDGQVLVYDADTDTWIPGEASISTPGDGMVPYYIDTGETFTVPLFKQALFSETISGPGLLVVEGILIEVD